MLRGNDSLRGDRGDPGRPQPTLVIGTKRPTDPIMTKYMARLQSTRGCDFRREQPPPSFRQGFPPPHDESYGHPASCPALGRLIGINEWPFASPDIGAAERADQFRCAVAVGIRLAAADHLPAGSYSGNNAQA
jgi:hypothetical protein